jgi:FtsP/CotA-like multicopper oxidase with cupredoxin domain
MASPWSIPQSFASDLVEQTWLPGDTIFAEYAFEQKLPVFGPGYNADFPRVDADHNHYLQVTMKEINQQVFPDRKPTRVWAYEIADADTGTILGPAHWPAVTVDSMRNIPVNVKYVNDLPSWDPVNDSTDDDFTAGGLVQGLVTVDQTIHWANPLGDTGAMICESASPPAECFEPYTGTVPAVPHLHGGETASAYDGGPEQWFTADGAHQGKDYESLFPVPGNQAVYRYYNYQDPGTLWFHDHALGATRTNVYSGLASFYLIRSNYKEPRNLPSGAYEIEMAIQDRQFDTNGQLYFPDGSGDTAGNLNGPPPNPTIHPFWIPEFAGDVVIVNGIPWPKLEVEPRRYRFRLLNGSNARFYNLSFGNMTVYVIGRDDAYLNRPVPVHEVLFAPGQRVDLIVDFAQAQDENVTVTNNASVPYPSGDLVPGDTGQEGMAQIMRFQVTHNLLSRDRSCNPATGGCGLPWYARTVPLTNGHGGYSYHVKVDKVRQLVLKEVGSDDGPLDVLVNNTKWDGLHSPNIAASFPVDGVSELPQVGSTELWEIINLTMDAHPMHTHLVQFQVLNRQPFLQDPENPAVGYPGVWAAAFGSPDTAPLGSCTAGQLCPGYGPPLPYNNYGRTTVINGRTVPVLGGNPDVGPYLLGAPRPPSADEAGWNDTAIVMPGEVLRLVVRWAPTSEPEYLVQPGDNFYPFDPTQGPGYVWHCHIIDHEDNEIPALIGKMERTAAFSVPTSCDTHQNAGGENAA